MIAAAVATATVMSEPPPEGRFRPGADGVGTDSDDTGHTRARSDLARLGEEVDTAFGPAVLAGAGPELATLTGGRKAIEQPVEAIEITEVAGVRGHG